MAEVCGIEPPRQRAVTGLANRRRDLPDRYLRRAAFTRRRFHFVTYILLSMNIMNTLHEPNHMDDVGSAPTASTVQAWRSPE